MQRRVGQHHPELGAVRGHRLGHARLRCRGASTIGRAAILQQ